MAGENTFMCSGESKEIRGVREITVVIENKAVFPRADVVYDGLSNSLFVNNKASLSDIIAALKYICKEFKYE